MYLIVGLGNPGSKYARTHHNAGFDVVTLISEKLRIPLTKLRCKAVLGEGSYEGERVVLAQPQTFMNLSGESVVALMNWYKPEWDHLLVVYDDVDLPLGKLRVRAKGSAGTHNGMKSILYLTGRDDFPRLRIGSGRPPEGWDLADYVLTGYRTQEEMETAFAAYQRAAESALIWIRDGFAKAAAFANAEPCKVEP